MATAKAERSFSIVKHILSDYWRSTMHECLRNLNVLSHETYAEKHLKWQSISAFKIKSSFAGLIIKLYGLQCIIHCNVIDWLYTGLFLVLGG